MNKKKRKKRDLDFVRWLFTPYKHNWMRQYVSAISIIDNREVLSEAWYEGYKDMCNSHKERDYVKYKKAMKQ